MRASPGARAIVFALIAVAIQFVLVTAYAWPAARLAPRHLPVVIAGPARPAAALAAQLTHEHPAAFDVIREPSQAAARRVITGRRAYGAIVVGGTTPQVLTASAASPAVAQLLTQIAGHMFGVTSPVRDVEPTDPNDPHGAAFAALLLPLVITSIAAGAMLTLLVGSAPWRLAGLAVFAVGGGAVTAAIAWSWLSVLPGGYFTVAAVTGLVALAVAAAVAGLGSLTGRAAAGLGLGIAIMMALGNPFSGSASAPEMLPRPWGQVGQWLPPGAGSTLLRSVDYFGGARSGGLWATLAIWAAVGLALVALSAARTRRRAPEPAPAASGAARATVDDPHPIAG
jgi:hypothetical protein